MEALGQNGLMELLTQVAGVVVDTSHLLAALVVLVVAEMEPPIQQMMDLQTVAVAVAALAAQAGLQQMVSPEAGDQVLSSSATQDHSVEQVEQLIHLVVTPTIPLHHPAHTRHKEQRCP